MSIKQDISKTWNVVPTPVRGGVYIVGIGIVAYIGYKIYKKLQIDAMAQEIKDKQAAYEKAGIKQTYVDSQYQAMHDTIYDAVEGFTNAFSTDVSAIYGVFRKLKNELDLAKLQEYDYQVGWIITENYTLDAYLKKKLNKSQLGQINSILKANRINYQF